MAWRNNKREGSKRTDSAAQPFWVTCPKCREKIAAPLDWVLKYLDRIGWEAGPRQEG